MKINSENIGIALFIGIELNDIKRYNETLKFIQREKDFVNDRKKYLESELMLLQSNIECLDEMKNQIDVDQFHFLEIESIDDIPDLVANSYGSVENQCDNLLKMYNEHLASDDVEIKRMLLELRPKLEAFTTFDSNGVGTMKTEIDFEEYIELNILDSLSNLFEYVEDLNKEPVALQIQRQR